MANRKVIPLSDTKIKTAKPQEKDYLLSDGDGLYLNIKSIGSKVWTFRYTHNSKAKKTTFGTYPTISLQAARKKRDEYKELISSGEDPITVKRVEKESLKREAAEQINTFEFLFEKWLEVKSHKIEAKTLLKLKRTFELYFLPFIGHKPINEIGKHEYIELILRMRDKGIIYYANKAKGQLQQFLNYLEESNILENAPTIRLENALPKPKQTNYPHITDTKELGILLNSIDNYNGDTSTKYALMFAALVFVRPANIRFMEWSEIDFEKKVWRIPAEKMKMNSPHIVPLSKQAINILSEIKKINGSYKYVFVSPVSTVKPLSENTLNMGLMRIGYKGIMVSHGFRHTASTMLHEYISEHGFHSEVIERQLAHAERNSVKAAYNHAEYMKERTALMQWWADYLDGLRNNE